MLETHCTNKFTEKKKLKVMKSTGFLKTYLGNFEIPKNWGKKIVLSKPQFITFNKKKTQWLRFPFLFCANFL